MMVSQLIQYRTHIASLFGHVLDAYGVQCTAFHCGDQLRRNHKDAHQRACCWEEEEPDPGGCGLWGVMLKTSLLPRGRNFSSLMEAWCVCVCVCVQGCVCRDLSDPPTTHPWLLGLPTCEKLYSLQWIFNLEIGLHTPLCYDPYGDSYNAHKSGMIRYVVRLMGVNITHPCPVAYPVPTHD